MSDSSDKSKTENALSLDLSQLQDLSIGPDWSDSARNAEARRNKPGGKPGAGKGPKRDRRPDRPARKPDAGGDARDSRPPRHDGPRGGDRGDRGPRGERGGERRQGGGRRGERQSAPPFKPVVDVAFYPEDTPFKALCHAMRTNCRTYELFEIARLILDKPERFVVVLHPKKDEGPQEFFISVPDGVPFTSEDQAVSHVLKHHLERFVETQEIEVDPPKGNFPAVNKCGFTGELLGPPNYHRYQALLVEHHAINLPNMPFEKFQSRIEAVKDEAVIQQWIEKMRKETVYKVKVEGADETERFDNLESLKFYLVNNRRAEIVRSANQARFSGKLAEDLPRGPLRDSILGWREQQHRFPLETANNLRGRLRRMHFTIYKRGSKGASFVCAVKRKFRNPQTRLAESLQDLIDFIEKHPNINVAALPEQFLGIEMKARAPEPVEEKAPDIEAVPKEEAEKIVEKHEQKRAAKEAGEEPVEDAAPQGAPEPDAKPEAKVSDSLDDPSLRQMMRDLRWLITEGYVTEYGDGRLFAPSPMDDSSAKAKADNNEDADDHQETEESDEHDEAHHPEAQAEPEPKADEPQSETETKPEEPVASNSESKEKAEPDEKSEPAGEPEKVR